MEQVTMTDKILNLIWRSLCLGSFDTDEGTNKYRLRTNIVAKANA
jgi:hypothetical protein